ncbi:peptidoglycan/LPS O-acetylase OafA/YrhL [Chitinophaga dinghuensis]|uniref:Peptidoglycan/LPS O-acetylase OafA/YrhL n=1 Tax=Chitinophaga dinghuensis TaxID=1539050 RepID=A0A327W997_9BACT|nr:acyltransferase [Chitinophaga dinghuensis]RAJ85812.1 peptidoglycan/LPS O-acetylase OafA/YrhL [Chitinophaga dinghuensis]
MGENNSIRHFDFIDAVRGLAVAAVVLVHSAQGIVGLSPLAASLFSKGQYGVQLFFIASALTLFMSYGQREQLDGKQTVPFFFLRRFFRIAPMYYIAIIFYSLILLFNPPSTYPNDFHFGYMILAMLFLNGVFPSNVAINYVPPGGWSVAVEMLFYLLIPILYRKIRNLKSAILFGFATLVISILCKYLAINVLRMSGQDYSAWLPWFLYFWLPNQLPVFAIGIVLFFLIGKPGSTNSENAKLKAAGLLLLSVLWIGLVITGGQYLNPYGYYQEHFLIAIGFGLLVRGLSIWQFPIFVNKYMISLGKVSFSLYLIHFVVIRVVMHFLARLNLPSVLTVGGVFVCTLVVSYFLSSLSYKLIEQKGTDIGKRLINRLKKPNTLVSVEQ